MTQRGTQRISHKENPGEGGSLYSWGVPQDLARVYHRTLSPMRQAVKAIRHKGTRG